jgi:hypothetical protein
MLCLEVVAPGGERAGAPNWCVTRLGKMQSLSRFLFHGDTEGIALHVTSEQRTEEQRHTKRDCEQKNNRDRRKKDQEFPLQTAALPAHVVTIVRLKIACYSCNSCN